MNGFLNTVEFSNKKIVHGELCLKDYKTILKCLIGDSVDPVLLYQNLQAILHRITKLNIDEIDNLNIIEFFALLVSIRQTSIGGSLQVVYNNNGNKINLDIPLEETFNTLQNAINSSVKKFYEDTNFKFAVSIPRIKDYVLKNGNDNSFITEIHINNENVSTDLVDSLPIAFFNKIKPHINDIKNTINSIPFFNPSISKYRIFFSTQPQEYFHLIKIIFNENLITIYNNIFKLNRLCNIPANYIEECTYGEYKIFVNNLNQLFAANTTTTDTTPEEDYSYEQVDINSLYGNDDLGDIISKSEFTP